MSQSERWQLGGNAPEVYETELAVCDLCAVGASPRGQSSAAPRRASARRGMWDGCGYTFGR